jgi:hypothetical protein
MPASALDLALRLTLLDLLLAPIGDWRIRPLVLGLAGAGLLLPALLRRPALWLALAVLAGVRVALDWPLSDNHAYLLGYWCLAISLALWVDDSEQALRQSARLLIGFAFVFATLWKVGLSPDYLDGTFFRVTLLLDGRFEDATLLLGRVTPELLDEFRVALEQHLDGAMPGLLGIPVEPPRFRQLAWLATLWTTGIEAAVALVFLWPLGGRLARVRDGLLLLFCATTYLIAPVYGFAWLLLAMGAAQCEPERRTARVLYVAAFGLVLLYREIPWARLLGVAQ